MWNHSFINLYFFGMLNTCWYDFLPLIPSFLFWASLHPFLETIKLLNKGSYNVQLFDNWHVKCNHHAGPIMKKKIIWYIWVNYGYFDFPNWICCYLWILLFFLKLFYPKRKNYIIFRHYYFKRILEIESGLWIWEGILTINW